MRKLALCAFCVLCVACTTSYQPNRQVVVPPVHNDKIDPARSSRYIPSQEEEEKAKARPAEKATVSLIELVATRTAVDASRYTFDLVVELAPQLAGFDPDVAHGTGTGTLRGARRGALGCIKAGAWMDIGSGHFVVLGILLSPACAVIGGLVGAASAESKEDAAARMIEALSKTAADLGYPEELPRLLAMELQANSIYRIHSGGGRETSGAGQEETPNASIHVRITEYGLTRFGVGAYFQLQLSAVVCVTANETGEALSFEKLAVRSDEFYLTESGARSSHSFLEALTTALTRKLATSAEEAFGHLVSLGDKPSCSWQDGPT